MSPMLKNLAALAVIAASVAYVYTVVQQRDAAQDRSLFTYCVVNNGKLMGDKRCATY